MRVFDKQFHILLKEDIREKIRDYAFKTNVSKAEFIRLAVEKYISQLEKKEAKQDGQ